MFAFARLPLELFGEILCLACDDSIEEKYAVAQVSQRWRCVALGTPLLWSSFRLHTEVDCLRLPTILERAGASTGLDVLVKIPRGSPADVDEVMRLLVPFATRIRSFEADLSRGQTLAPLLAGEMSFLALDTLRVRAAGHPHVSFASAPHLRVVDLCGVSLTHFAPHCFPGLSSLSPHLPFSTVLSQAQRLKVLQITRSDWEPSYLPYIFVLCPQLVSLGFHTLEPDNPDGVRFSVPKVAPVLSALRSLDLQLPLEDILDLLSLEFPAVLNHVSASLCNLPSANGMVQLIDALLSDFGPVVTLDWQNSYTIVLHDAAGRQRILCTWGHRQRFNIQEIWRCLATRHSAHRSVQRIIIPTPGDHRHWDTLASALAEHPLQTQQPTTIRILAGWDDVRILPRRPDLPSIDVPALRRVEFARFSELHTDVGFTEKAVVYFLQRLSRRDDNTRTVEVVLEAPCVIEDDWRAKLLTASHLESTQQAMRTRVAKEVPGSWQFSFK